MKGTLQRLLTYRSTLLAAVVTLATGCSQMPPASALFDPSPEAEGTGIMGVGLVRAVVIIAKYQATERQRQVALQNARAAQRRLAPEQPAAQSAKKGSGAETASSGQRSGSSVAKRSDTRGTKPAAKTSARERPVAKKKKLPRYIAVDTERDERSQGGKNVMIFDTQSQEIVGNEVYDVKTAPKLLETARFDTYSAQYVGGL